jgi:ribosomal protein L28
MNHVARLIKKKVGGRPDAAGVSVDTEKRACYVQATAIHEALVKGGQGGRNLTVNAVTKALKQLDKKGSARRVYIDGKQVRAWEISLGLLVDQGLLEWEDVIKEGAER